MATLAYEKQRRLLSDWLIYYPGTQGLTKRAQSKSSKQRWRRKERFHYRHCFIACSRVLGECCSFLLCPRYSEWQENVGHESSNFSQVTVFAFAGEQLFPQWLEAGCRLQNTRSKSACVKV